MKAKITSKIIKACAVVLLILFNLTSTEGLRGNTGSEFHPVDSNQIPNVLTMISAQVRSNYDRIKTWEGKIEVVTDTIYKGARAEKVFKTRTDGKGEIPKVVIRHIEGKRQFVVDLEKDLLYTKLSRENPPYYMDFQTGRDLGTKSMPWYVVSIVTPEHHVHCTGDTMRDGVVISRRAVKQARPKGSTCASLMPSVYDPRESFIPGRPIWETFPQVLQYTSEHGEINVAGNPLKVEECTDGGITEYRVQLPGNVSPEEYIFMTMVFSSEKGFNITSLETTKSNGKLLRKNTWDYDLVNGVYVPSRTTEQIFERKNGELSYEAKYTFKNAKTNHPISQETFTYKNLGLKNGDKFVDRILDKEYTYQDGELTLTSKKK